MTTSHLKTGVMPTLETSYVSDLPETVDDTQYDIAKGVATSEIALLRVTQTELLTWTIRKYISASVWSHSTQMMSVPVRHM
jgi:hypothetical protein